VDWVHGKLLVKAGFEVEPQCDATSLLRNQTGTYTYASVVNFASDALAFAATVSPNSTQIQPSTTATRPARCGTTRRATCAAGQSALLLLLFADHGPHQLAFEHQRLGRLRHRPVAAEQAAVVSAGLRWEREQLPPPIAALANPELPLTEKLPSLGNNWGPRVSLAYRGESGAGRCCGWATACTTAARRTPPSRPR
jgi:hypothetical protein